MATASNDDGLLMAVALAVVLSAPEGPGIPSAGSQASRQQAGG
jgi:hypothetical protein